MFTEDDNRLIQEAFDRLMKSSEHLFWDDERRKLVQKAFEFANRAHYGVRRKSGEPYILHPISVALIVVSEIGLGVKSICAALLHDVVEDTDYTVENIESLFGQKIASMVDGLTKLKQAGDLAANTEHPANLVENNSEQAENFKKMLFTLSDDVRVMLIKLADRLHNMRTLDSMLPHKKVKIVSETMYLFAPLAHRLGLFTIKAELEDLCFKHSYPKDYYEIERKMNETAVERSDFIEKFNAPLIRKLKEKGIDFTISGREKSIYSIWKKMQRKGVPFEEVYDLFAIRIIFKEPDLSLEKEKCWSIFGVITDTYTPKPDRIRDWINLPKANGYEALHCTVMGPSGVWVEVQIRSERMNDIAERGFAAHWKYKGNKFDNNEGELDKWLELVRNALNSPVEDATAFLDDFKMNLYTSEIVIFTPEGDPRILPKNSTVLDFAFEIHSKLGYTAIGAKVNHQLKPLYTILSSGDQVEILTSQTATPNAEWLDHVVTIKAKQSIKHYLKKNYSNSVARGQELFNEELLKYGIKQPTARIFHKVMPEYNCNTKDEFYSKIGSGIIRLDHLEKILKSSKSNKLINFWSLDLDSVNPFKIFGGGTNKTKEEVGEKDFEIADCCHPIPEDEIVAFKQSDGKIIVHKKNCTVAIDYAAKYGDRIVKASWSSKMSMFYLCKIRITGNDRMGLLMDISHIISTLFRINIRQLTFQSHNAVFECEIVLYVSDNNALKEVMSRVQGVKGVDKVIRVELNEKIGE